MERAIDVGEVVDAILGGDVVGAGQVGQVVAVAGQGCWNCVYSVLKVKSESIILKTLACF